MKFYGDNGFPEFQNTANFLIIIRKMRNISKVKTPSIGKAKCGSTCEQIKEATAEQLDYFVNFVSWVKDWKTLLIQSLTRETTNNCSPSSLLSINPLVTDPRYLACTVWHKFEKKSYEGRAYESVDDRSHSYVISKKSTENNSLLFMSLQLELLQDSKCSRWSSLKYMRV